MPKVIGIEIVELEKPVEVFDIEVEHDESFVASDCVLHNSTICKARSGLQWNLKTKEPVGHLIPWNGGPPLHFQCRSVTVAVLKPISKIPKKKKQAIEEAGTQSSMDGQVPDDMDYQSWLKTKSISFQKEALGPGRWQLWKDGKLTLPQMLDMRGNPLTLAELQRKYG
jgi:hypothetical protein